MTPSPYHISGTNAKTIAESVERAIDAGRFPVGSRLPTIRALAERLGVSPTTVAAAFKLARARGRIVGSGRTGSIVAKRAALQSGDPHTTAPGLVDLAVANPDRAFLPSLVDAFARLDPAPRLYTDVRDDPSLLDVARRGFAGDRVPDTHVGVASGAMDAIERALAVSLAPGDVVALEDPTYPPYAELARALGLATIRVALDGRGILPAALARALRAGAKALIVIPRAQNPTGAAFDAARVHELARVLDRAPRTLVIEDDYVSAVAGVPLVSLARTRERFLVVRSLAKILGPDLRIALSAADPLTASRMLARQRLGPGWVSVALQEAAGRLLRDPATRRRIRAAEAAYLRRRDALRTALAEVGVSCAPGASGFTLWVPVADESAAVGTVREAGFAIDGGARYREHAPPGVRITTTALDDAMITRVVPAIARVVTATTTAPRP